MSSPQPRDRTLPRTRRIPKRPQILELQSSGKKLYSRHFLVIARPSERGDSRIAITVTKKVHKRAVVRNRIKRRVREVFRNHREKLSENFDILVIARKNAGEVDYHNVRREILGALHHSGYLR